ncbi:MAG: hypothetical protein JO027_12450 [Solirubrobacterales bacterium]|nr:hypothetical protein [Solirubrobacterales bacterium]
MRAQPLSRRLTGSCLIAAPLLILAGLILTPYPPHTGTRSYQDTLAAHPTQAQIAAIVLEIGYILLVPAVFGLIAHARPAARWLRTTGAVLAVIGSAILPGLLVTDIYDLALAQKLPRGLSVAVADHAGNSLAAVIMSSPAFIGAVLGMTLLIAAAWRAGLAPAWAAPLVLAGSLIARAQSLGPAVIAGVLLLTAYGTVGRRLIQSQPQATNAPLADPAASPA